LAGLSELYGRDQPASSGLSETNLSFSATWFGINLNPDHSAEHGSEAAMHVYMDVHEHLPEGATAADVAKAHEADLAKQGEYGVNYKSYWVDDKAGKVFCLVEAPDAETAARVHREAHGLVADHIYEVAQGS